MKCKLFILFFMLLSCIAKAQYKPKLLINESDTSFVFSQNDARKIAKKLTSLKYQKIQIGFLNNLIYNQNTQLRLQDSTIVKQRIIINTQSQQIYDIKQLNFKKDKRNLNTKLVVIGTAVLAIIIIR